MQCNLCDLPLDEPIYRSPGDLSVNSICELYSFRIEVYYCPRCTHLQSTQLTDLEAYYDHTYKMLADTEEEDDLYEVADDQRVYRYPHQANTLLAKVSLPVGARTLDYGCAKGTTLRHVLTQRPDVRAHLFDVSRSYLPFWEKFLPPENWAVYEPKEDWASYFDLVTSFFVLEHTPHPVSTLMEIRKLLRPEGQVYLILPNVYANICDFVVADHVNHFSPASLCYAFGAAELDLLEIDQRSHRNAFIVIARKGGRQEPGLPTAAEREQFHAQVGKMAAYWKTFADRIHNFESAHKSEPSAIYGAGVYGALTAITLANRSNVVCFVDRNPHLQGKTLLDKPVLPPERLPEDVRVVYVCLNPAIAKAEMKKLPSWVGRPLTYYYL